jgi:hypothetical protein
VGGEVTDVGVAPGDEVAARGRHGLVQRLALALTRAQLREDVVHRQHPGAGVGGDASRVVGGVIVHHQDLVHEPAALQEDRADLRDDRPDGGRLVPGGDADAHHVAVTSLVPREGGGVEVTVPVGPEDGPPHGAIQPARPGHSNLRGPVGMGARQGWFGTIARSVPWSHPLPEQPR